MADEISFVTSAPRSVVVNQHFKISYKVNRVKVAEPTIPEIDRSSPFNTAKHADDKR